MSINREAHEAHQRKIRDLENFANGYAAGLSTDEIRERLIMVNLADQRLIRERNLLNIALVNRGKEPPRRPEVDARKEELIASGQVVPVEIVVP